MTSKIKKEITNGITNTGDKSSTKIPGKWPIVVNTNFKNTDVARLLQQRHKVRFSDTTLASTCIFPVSAVAFMIVPLAKASLEWPPKSGQIQLDHEFIDRVQKFVQIHRNSYMVITSALHGPHEMAVISAIQMRFIDYNLRILPVHNDSEGVQTILIIAQATCKPTCSILKSRLDAILSKQIGEEVVLNILSEMGLNHHDCMVLQQGCGTLAAVATATREQLMDCSLDSGTVDKITSFFDKDDFVDG